jgi:hypothetical protein
MQIEHVIWNSRRRQGDLKYLTVSVLPSGFFSVRFVPSKQLAKGR